MKKSASLPPAEGTRPAVTLDEVVESTALSKPAPPSGALCRATVRTRRRDGAIEVVPTDGSPPFMCDVLDTAELQTAELREGDSVVTMTPAMGQGRGCVLGRVRRGAGSSPESRLPETLLIEAGKELVLRVGEGSITIRADGRVLIRGKDLVSHAKRMNRIRGGSVSLN